MGNLLVWLLIAGQMVAIFASWSLVDRWPILLLSFLLFLGALFLNYDADRTEWGKLHRRSLRKLAVWAVVALLVLDAAVIGNWLLDRKPAAEIRADVLEKQFHRDRGTRVYTLLIGPSWRPGRDYESLDVSEDTFSRVAVGGKIAVDVHAGFFRLSWYNNVRRVE